MWCERFLLRGVAALSLGVELVPALISKVQGAHSLRYSGADSLLTGDAGPVHLVGAMSLLMSGEGDVVVP